MAGQLRQKVIALGDDVAEQARSGRAESRVPGMSVVSGSVNDRTRALDCAIQGHADIDEGAVMIGCIVEQGVHVHLGPGAVAIACLFEADTDIGADSTVMCSGFGYCKAGKFTCGKGCVVAEVSILAGELYGKTGYQVHKSARPCSLAVGDNARLVNAAVYLIGPQNTAGSGMVLYGMQLELGYNAKTVTEIGDNFTVVHGYAKIGKLDTMALVNNDNDAAAQNIRGMGLTILTDHTSGYDRYVQLLSHAGTIKVGSDVTIGTSTMLHAQKRLEIGDGCAIQPVENGRSKLRMGARNIILGRQSLVASATGQSECRQDVGGITHTGLFCDITTGYRSRLTVVTDTARVEVGFNLEEERTGYL